MFLGGDYLLENLHMLSLRTETTFLLANLDRSVTQMTDTSMNDFNTLRSKLEPVSPVWEECSSIFSKSLINLNCLGFKFVHPPPL